MSLSRVVYKFLLVIVLTSFIQTLGVAEAAPQPYPASLQKLHEIYTHFNNVVHAASATNKLPEALSVSVEDELKYFEENVRDIESAQEFIKNLSTFIHPNPGFDHKAKLHPYLQEIRDTLLQVDLRIPGVLYKPLANQAEQANPGTWTRSEVLDKSMFVFFLGHVLGPLWLGGEITLVRSKCMELCFKVISGMTNSELLTRGGEFPGAAFICESYVYDRDSSRYSNSPRFNYNGIEQQMGVPNCWSLGSSRIPLVFALHGVCTLAPLAIYAGYQIYDAACLVGRLVKKYGPQPKPIAFKLPESLRPIFDKVQTELGIRHIDSILTQLLGIRVLAHPCSNEFDNCPICREDFQGFEGTVSMECCHKKFDQNCINEWFARAELNQVSKDCPSCRSKF